MRHTSNCFLILLPRNSPWPIRILKLSGPCNSHAGTSLTAKKLKFLSPKTSPATLSSSQRCRKLLCMVVNPWSSILAFSLFLEQNQTSVKKKKSMGLLSKRQQFDIQLYELSNGTYKNTGNWHLCFNIWLSKHTSLGEHHTLAPVDSKRHSLVVYRFWILCTSYLMKALRPFLLCRYFILLWPDSQRSTMQMSKSSFSKNLRRLRGVIMFF